MKLHSPKFKIGGKKWKLTLDSSSDIGVGLTPAKTHRKIARFYSISKPKTIASLVRPVPSTAKVLSGSYSNPLRSKIKNG